MAVKTKKTKEIKETSMETEQVKETIKEHGKADNKWAMAGWVLLLFGGLAHMLPDQMAPILKWSMFSVSLQMAVGVISVILALNFLLED